MKPLLSEQQIKEHQAASLRGAIEGAVVSGTVAAAGSYLLHRRWPSFRQMPLSLKTLGIVVVVAPCISIQAERRGLEYEKSQWEGESLRILDERKLQEDARWREMPMKDRIAHWADQHQYTMILGGWALALMVAGSIISRDKYLTTAQKVVQARMWAQGLTIGILIGAGALTHNKRIEATKHRNTDHSWKDLLDQQERDRRLEQRELELTEPGHQALKVPV